MQEVTPEAAFAARVRQAREDRDMSQAQLAELLRVEHDIRLDPTAITRIERGRRMIRLNEAAALSDVLGVQWWDLFVTLWVPADADDLSAAHPARLRAKAARLTAELAELDAGIARADSDAMQARVRGGELRRRREQVQLDLAMLAALPGLAGGADEGDGHS